jgi:hypothetical protein
MTARVGKSATIKREGDTMRQRVLRTLVWMLVGLFALPGAMLASRPAMAQEGSCIDDVTGRTNDCAATDVQLCNFVNDVATTCMPGEPVTLNLRVRLLATSLERYDIGMFLALDGGNAGAGSCRRAFLPAPLSSGGTCSISGDDCKKDADCLLGETCTGGYNPDSGVGPFYDAEPEDAPDECGDLEPGVDTYYLLAPMTVECIDSDGDGFLDIGTAVSWDDAKDGTCQDVDDAVPDAAARCRYATVAVANVIVYPGLMQVQKSAQPRQILEPGGWVTFTFAVTNNSPLTLTLEGLDDSVYGPLEQANGDCRLPQVLSPAATYVCTTRAEVTGAPGIHRNTVAAWGTDWRKNAIYGAAEAEVTIVAEPPDSGVGMPAAVVTGGLAAAGSLLLLAGVLLRRRTA